MSDPLKIYWDSCAWISLINRDADRAARCDEVVRMWSAGEAEVWTSTITYAEVFKKKCAGVEVAIDATKDADFEALLGSDSVMLVQVDAEVGKLARQLLRTHSALKKPNDAIHLASAILYNLDAFHTFDVDNLLSLNGVVKRKDGLPLPIIIPPLPIQGALNLEGRVS